MKKLMENYAFYEFDMQPYFFNVTFWVEAIWKLLLILKIKWF